MKNLIKLIGIIALVTVIGFSMTACEEDNDKNYDDKDNTLDGDANGKLLLTDIPQKYNGGYISIPVLANSDKSIRLGGFQSLTFKDNKDTTTYVKISNGKANIPMWIIDGYKTPVKYYGNDTVTSVSTGSAIYIHKEATNQEANYTELARGFFPDDPIVFVNGFAEKSLKDVYWFIDNVE